MPKTNDAARRPLTDESIRGLRATAALCGDSDTVALCDLALRPFGSAATIRCRGTIFSRDSARAALRAQVVSL